MNNVTINRKQFNEKNDDIKKLILESLEILTKLGIPTETMSDRAKERIAMALLAVGDVKKSSEWKKIKDSNNIYEVTSRQIIIFHNTYLGDNISSGSYDDIRRKDLAKLEIAEIVTKSKPDSNNSDPRRGYKISPTYARIIKNYGQSDWDQQVEEFNKSHPTYEEKLNKKRSFPMLTVTAPDGTELKLADGEHNSIQKSVIELFLPRFGYEATVLYCGDASNKYNVINDKEKLAKIGITDLKQGKLPDIVAYSSSKDWIYLIEAYHSSNPITPERKYFLEKLLGENKSKAVFVTAFENIKSYKNCPEDLAWETEVWIASEPDHLIHRNGFRFMGPYNK